MGTVLDERYEEYENRIKTDTRGCFEKLIADLLLDILKSSDCVNSNVIDVESAINSLEV